MERPGTGEEKATLQKNCSGCHSWQQIFRNRYDERSWRLILDRMMHFSGTSLVVRMGGNGGVVRADAPDDKDFQILANWLPKVRGPNSPDMPFRIFPRPRGASTHVVVTEYELPRDLLALHDAAGDAQGNIWFSSHKTRYVGKLDPRTGIVTEYTMPLTPGAMPGTHAVVIDKNGTIWFSENWAHILDRLDPQNGKVTQVKIETPSPLNAPGLEILQSLRMGLCGRAGEASFERLKPKPAKSCSNTHSRWTSPTTT